jgi:hypothetical protein
VLWLMLLGVLLVLVLLLLPCWLQQVRGHAAGLLMLLTLRALGRAWVGVMGAALAPCDAAPAASHPLRLQAAQAWSLCSAVGNGGVITCSSSTGASSGITPCGGHPGRVQGICMQCGAEEVLWIAPGTHTWPHNDGGCRVCR